MNFPLSLTLLIRDSGLSLLFMAFGYLQFHVRRSQAGLFILLKNFFALTNSIRVEGRGEVVKEAVSP